MKQSIFFASLLTALFAVASAFAGDEEAKLNVAEGSAVAGVGAGFFLRSARQAHGQRISYQNEVDDAREALLDLERHQHRLAHELNPDLEEKVERIRADWRERLKAITASDRASIDEIYQNRIKRVEAAMYTRSNGNPDFDAVTKAIDVQKNYVEKDLHVPQSSRWRYVMPKKWEKPYVRATVRAAGFGAAAVAGAGYAAVSALGLGDEKIETPVQSSAAPEAERQPEASANFGE